MKNKKAVVFVMLGGLILSLACVGTPTLQPTYTPYPTYDATEEKIDLPECNSQKAKDYLLKEATIWASFGADYKAYGKETSDVINNNGTLDQMKDVLTEHLLTAMNLHKQCEDLSVPYPLWEEEHSFALKTLASYSLLLGFLMTGSESATQAEKLMFENWDAHNAEVENIFRHCNWPIPKTASDS